MSTITLGYGKTQIEFEYDESRFQVLSGEESSGPLSDVEIGEKLDLPIDSKTIEEIINPNETVLLIVPDATRNFGTGQIVNLLVRRLIANGTMPFEINVMFATGIHRRVTEEEKQEILTPFIAQRLKTIDHNPRNLAQIIRLGETADGIPIELNRAITEFDHTIIIGGITFHYFAGFTGGRKSVCPGLASSKTISETHKLAFDRKRKSRRKGVEVGRLDGNPVHESFTEVVEKKPPTFAINTIVNDTGEIVDLYCGDWKTSHKVACEEYGKSHTINIKEKRDVIIVSCGGSPYDLNMIQAHKALEMASHACKEGGKIFFLAECANGLGRKDFIDWFNAKTSDELADKLCSKYQVNGQTAWSLLKKAEKFDIEIVTNLPKGMTDKMRLKKVSNLNTALKRVDSESNGYILRYGAKFLLRI